MTKKPETDAAKELLTAVREEMIKRQQAAVLPPATIVRFLQIWEILAKFEAQHRAIRGYGAFQEHELPVPEAIATIQWLKKLAGQPEDN